MPMYSDKVEHMSVQLIHVNHDFQVLYDKKYRKGDSNLRLIIILHSPISSHCAQQNTADLLFSLKSFMSKCNKPNPAFASFIRFIYF